MALKGILFDKDGTLIDFDATWGPAALEVMRSLAAGDAAALRSLMRVSHYIESERRFLPSSPLMAGSAAQYGPLWAEVLQRPDRPEFHSEIDRLFLAWGLRTLTPIGEPGVIAAALRQRGLRLGIATNDAENSARVQAEALGLSAHLDYVAGYDSGFGSKPEPGMVHGFAQACRLAPHEIAVVGDTLHDLRAATAAGAVAVAVLTGPRNHEARAELEPHADHVVGSIADVPALIDGLREKQSCSGWGSGPPLPTRTR